MRIGRNSPVAGGHSIDSPEPIYGLAVTGICKTEEVRRKSDAKPRDAIILTKPLGVGIYSAAIKKGVLPPAGYAEMLATTTLLNWVGAELAKNPAVHGVTDVTGFGLLGHGLEMARSSELTVVVRAVDLPLIVPGRGAGAAGLCHRCLDTKLGELQRRRKTAGGSPRLAAPPADRSANIRRAAGILRA